MATRTISDTGGSWTNTATWNEGVVPTSSDDVIATATSGALSFPASGESDCKSLDFTNYTNTFTGNYKVLNIYGTLKLVSDMTIASYPNIQFQGSDGGNITTASKSFSYSITFDGTGTWTLQDDLTMVSNAGISLNSGGLNTNGKTVIVEDFIATGSNAISLTLGNSTITVNGGTFGDWDLRGTNITLSAASSTIQVGTGTNFYGGSRTYGTVYAFPNMRTADTFGTLIFGDATYYIYANLVVTATLTMGESPTLNLIASATFGTAQTITCTGATVTATYTKLRDITLTPAQDLSASTGGCGDCSGNSGVTFTTGINVYWHTGTGLAGTHSWLTYPHDHWFTATNGGGSALGRYPLPQDTVIFDDNSFDAASQIVALTTLATSGDIICTGVTNNPEFSFSGNIYFYGSITLDSNMSLSGTRTIYLMGRKNCTLTTAGKTFNQLYASTFNGSITLQDDLTCTNDLTFNYGTFESNDKNVNIVDFNSTGSSSRILNMGNGTWTLTGTETFNCNNATNLTINAESSTIIFSNTSSSSKAFYGNNQTYNNLSITGGGAGIVRIYNSNIFNILTINAPKTIEFEAGQTQTITSFVATGTVSNPITLNATAIGGDYATLSDSSGTNNVYYCTIEDINVTGGARWIAAISDNNTVTNSTGWILYNYVDIGLRIYNGITNVAIGCFENPDASLPIRIYKSGQIYGVGLVATNDETASKIRIYNGTSVKAVQAYS